MGSRRGVRDDLCRGMAATVVILSRPAFCPGMLCPVKFDRRALINGLVPICFSFNRMLLYITSVSFFYSLF